MSSQSCKSVLLPSPLPPQHHPSKQKMNVWYCVLWRLQTQASDDEGQEQRPRSTKLFKYVILINLYVPDPENIYVCTQLSLALWSSWSQRHYSPAKTESVDWGSVRKYQMEKVLPASPSFNKLQDVTNFAWFLGGRSCSFPSYSCATLFLELCPSRGKSSTKAPGTQWPCSTFSMSPPTGCKWAGTKPERRIQGWNSSHTMFCIKKLNVNPSWALLRGSRDTWGPPGSGSPSLSQTPVMGWDELHSAGAHFSPWRERGVTSSDSVV